MSRQRHVIKRQTVEITLAKKEDAWAFQQAFSRIFQERVAPLLDQLLSEASAPDSLHRIERLELDLGELDRNRLEADVLERIDEKLRQALREKIDRTQFEPVDNKLYRKPFADAAEAGPLTHFPIASKQQDDPLLANMELFEHFVREGYLPWWADNTQSQLPEKSFAALVNESPEALARLLARLIQEPRCLQRLVSYFEERQLIDMLALITTAPTNLATSLLKILQALQTELIQLNGIPISRQRNTLWQSLLQIAIAGEPAISSHAEFLTAVTARWSKLLGLSHKVLVAGLQRLASNESVIDNEWLRTIKLSAQTGQPSAMLDDNAINPKDETLNKLHPLYQEEKTAPKVPTAADMPIEDSSKEDADKLAQSRLARRQSINNPPPVTTASIGQNRDNLSFSEADALYINNSGLCILWPFLESFFERLELLQNGHFQGPTARQCAVSLLHYLATEELTPPEYFLPFNKLLCGMAIDEVYDFSTPLTAAQIEACDDLIGAVIGNAPILNNMSLSGFRGSFLLRRGVLSAGPGSWLLRVERETYDLVLDRFPWSWHWINLPWMSAPLRVEWP